jgi:hypothetical protein
LEGFESAAFFLSIALLQEDYAMRNRIVGSASVASIYHAKDANLGTIRSLLAAVVLTTFIAIPSPCSAQTTINLASDISYSIFENGTGSVSVSSSNVLGSVDMGGTNTPNINSSNVSSVKYNVQDPPVTVPSNGTATTVNVNSNSLTIVGSSGLNVFNASTFNLTSGLLTLVGNANSNIIFNISSGMTVNSSSIVLSGGLLASHVLYNVVNGPANISSSTLSGTVYTGGSNTLNFTSSALTAGALVAGGGGNITVTSSKIGSASPFVAPVASAPEMPTIMTAGFGAFLLLSSSYISRQRHKRSSTEAAAAA